MDLDSTVAALAPGLLRYCLARIGDHGLAEDIAQDALAALVQRWRRVGPPASPEAFVFGIARRRAGRALWRLSVVRRLRALVPRDPTFPAPDPEFQFQLSEEMAALARALRALPARDREVLLLVAAAELEHEQVASVLDVSRSAIKMRLHRARNRLKQLLERDNHARESHAVLRR